MLCCQKPAKVAESPEVRSGAGYWHIGTRKCGHTGRVLRSSQNLMRSSWYQVLYWLPLVTQIRPSQSHPLRAAGNSRVQIYGNSNAGLQSPVEAPCKRWHFICGFLATEVVREARHGGVRPCILCRHRPQSAEAGGLYKRKLAGKDREQSPYLVSPREWLEIEFGSRVFT